MKKLYAVLVLSALALVECIGPVTKARADVAIDFDTYAAVAYSRSTHKFGYAYNYSSRYAAEQAALARCRESDAKIVGWVKAGWLALAIGDNDNHYGVGWEYGEGANSATAKRTALRECSSRSKNARLVLCICSGDVAPQIYR